MGMGMDMRRMDEVLSVRRGCEVMGCRHALGWTTDWWNRLYGRAPGWLSRFYGRAGLFIDVTCVA